ncbi:MAG: hypothetical protein ABSC34_08840 [Acidimicrobiales bacterium]|jgi:hypothetical protein
MGLLVRWWSDTARAQRLARWYPVAWRQRYGDEFIDHMEQEIAERPHSIARTLNIVYRATRARLGDAGVLSATIGTSNQTRAAVASTFALAGVFLAIAFNFWASAMINWNGGAHISPVTVTWCTGAITVLVAVMALGVTLMYVSLLGVAVRRIVHHRAKRITAPLAVVLASTLYLVYAARESLRFVIARGGIAWGHPGWAIKQLAGVSQAVTSSVYLAWMSPSRAFDPGSNFVNALMPFVLVTLCLGVATLVRRSEWTGPSERIGRVATRAFVGLMAAFLVLYSMLTLFGGTGDVVNFAQPLRPWVLILESVVMTATAFVALSCARGLRRNEPLSIETA